MLRADAQQISPSPVADAPRCLDPTHRVGFGLPPVDTRQLIGRTSCPHPATAPPAPATKPSVSGQLPLIGGEVALWWTGTRLEGGLIAGLTFPSVRLESDVCR